ncbi:MAG: hypothetical protein ACR2LR_26255 [Hassallia sp.]
MSKFQNWFWEIQECGQGPHYYFNATFALSDAECLVALVRQHSLSGFVHCQFVGNLINAPCGHGNYQGAYDLYIDQYNYSEDFISLLESGKHRITCLHSQWNIIGVCGNELGIECGYGGVTSTHNEIGTSLIVAIAQSSEVTLVDWQVNSGGEGYEPVAFGIGKSATELLAHLQIKEPLY